MNTHVRSAFGLLGVLVMGVGAISQPPGDRDDGASRIEQPPADTKATGNAAEEFERHRERLRRRLEDVRRLEARLEDLLARLDAGEDPEQLREEIYEGRRGFRSGRLRDEGRPGAWIRGDRDRARRDGDGPEVDAEQVRAFVTDHLPELMERFDALREDRPDLAARLERGFSGRVAELMRLERENPEMFAVALEETRARLEIMSTVIRHRREGGVDEDALRAELRPLVLMQHELKLQSRRLEVEEMERRLRDLQERIEEHEQNSERLVDERVDDLVRFATRRRGGR